MYENVLFSSSDYITERITNTSLDFSQTPDANGRYSVTLNGTTVLYDVDRSLFAVRTCQSYFQPQETIQYTNIGPFIEGMSAGATEREDFIITPDLRGDVCTVGCIIVSHIYWLNRCLGHWISLEEI